MKHTLAYTNGVVSAWAKNDINKGNPYRKGRPSYEEFRQGHLNETERRRAQNITTNYLKDLPEFAK